MEPIMQGIVKFVTNTNYENLPNEVVEETKRIILDSIGCAIGARRMSRWNVIKSITNQTGGNPESTVFGVKGKVSSVNAAFANGELINALDLDALYGTHIPPYVIPSPIAVGESVSASGKLVILSVALGQEVARRLQMATQPTYWPVNDGKVLYPFVSGHSSGAIGAAVGAGKVLNLDSEKMANAIAIAGYAAPPSTFRKWQDTVPCNMTKYGPPGFAAEVGVRAAILASLGYDGDKDIFLGDYGFWRFTGHQQWNLMPILMDIGEKWKCIEVSYKKYPAGH